MFIRFITVLILVISVSYASTDDVFKLRMEKYAYSLDRFEGVRKDFEAIKKLVPADGVLDSAMHDRLYRNFVVFNEIQAELIRNWDDFHKLLRSGMPRDYQSQTRGAQEVLKAKLAGLGVVSRLTQFANSSTIISMFEDHKTIRRKLNELCKMTGSSYDDILEEFKDSDAKKGLLESSNIFLNFCSENNVLKELKKEDEHLLFIVDSVQKNKFLKELSDKSFIQKIADWFSILLSDSWEGISEGYRKFKVAVSKLFGNTVGNLKSSRKPYVNAHEIMPELLKVLKPGDVLIEKTGFLITDKFIPGHFGHVAIYSGKPGELFSGVLNAEKSIVDRKLNELSRREKKPRAFYDESSVVEALRPGVTFNSLEHFLHIDDLAVLRLKNNAASTGPVNEEYIRRELMKAFSYLATEYDFAFDVNTSDLIVCSELAYQTMPGVPFRVKPMMGSWTISPDDVAVAAGEGNRPFELIMFVHKGKIISDDKKLPLYISLLEAEDSAYNEFPSYSRARGDDEYNW